MVKISVFFFLNCICTTDNWVIIWKSHPKKFPLTDTYSVSPIKWSKSGPISLEQNFLIINNAASLSSDESNRVNVPFNPFSQRFLLSSSGLIKLDAANYAESQHFLRHRHELRNRWRHISRRSFVLLTQKDLVTISFLFTYSTHMWCCFFFVFCQSPPQQQLSYKNLSIVCFTF